MTTTIPRTTDSANGALPRQLTRIAHLVEQRPPGRGALLMIHHEMDDTSSVDWMAEQLDLPTPTKSTDGQRYSARGDDSVGALTVHVLCGITEPPEDEAARLRRRLDELDAQIAQAAP